MIPPTKYNKMSYVVMSNMKLRCQENSILHIYNGSSSLVSDAGRKIARIDYDRLNNPVRIQFTNGNMMKYVYSAAGENLSTDVQRMRKLKKSRPKATYLVLYKSISEMEEYDYTEK